MQTALKIQTTVTTEGKIEISMPELTPGKPVEIIILFPEPDVADGEPASAPPLSVIDILNRSPGQRQFKTPDDVEAYLRQERNAWDN
jgi:hypothetical protein